VSVENRCLVIESAGREDTRIPLGEVGAVVISNPAVVVTHPALAEMAGARVMLVVCDGRHMPVGMVMPLEANFVQGERIARQAGVSLPTRKRLWQALVRAKIRAQARVLREVRGDDEGLLELVRRVRSGDPDNVEGQASRRYWPALFGDARFRRDPMGEDQNRLLNYGYAVLRGIVARAVCGAGLHPSLGLHHHNRYDAFRLADDLMEPLRPVVDRAVARHCGKRGPTAPLDREAKAALVGALMGRFRIEGEERTLFDIAGRMAGSLLAVYAGERKSLMLPEW